MNLYTLPPCLLNCMPLRCRDICSDSVALNLGYHDSVLCRPNSGPKNIPFGCYLLISEASKFACCACKTDIDARGFDRIQEIRMNSDAHQYFIYSLCTNCVGSSLLTEI
jgi:hypothetical protein